MRLSLVVIVPSLCAWASAEPTSSRSFGTAKQGSSLYPPDVVQRLRDNVAEDPWAAGVRDSLIQAAQPWMDRSDDELWALMFGPGITRSWMVWSNGHCPACGQSVPMYNWKCDALNRPWKIQCPHCQEFFPKNDFLRFFKSGLDKKGVFDPARADRSLLFNTEHPDPADPKHKFGVDDGEGYVEGDKRWRFAGAYEIYGQWKQAVLGGIRTLSGAHLLTGDPVYAHKAAVMLDRVADLYPLFDFKEQAVVYERRLGSSGYVSVWHDACEETRELVMAYDMIFEASRDDTDLVRFLSGKAREIGLENPKSSFANIQRNIEDRILRDPLAQRPKITSNYPRTEITVAIIYAVLGGGDSKAAFDRTVDAMLEKATAVDGVTGEKGLSGYAVFTIQGLAMFLAEFSKADPGLLPRLLERHPRLKETYRFHIDTHCLGRYYPTCGDAGSFASAGGGYAGMPLTTSFARPTSFPSWTCVAPSCHSLLWDFYCCTGDVAYVQTLYRANGDRLDGLPFDLYAKDPAALRKAIGEVIEKEGAEVRLRSVNKQQWHLAILRSGQGRDARAAWLDYDSGGGHGHADGMNLGLYAKGLDLMPDLGYPPVQFGGWDSPRARWYTMTAAHNTVTVDGANTSPGAGQTTLWADGSMLHAIRVAGPALNAGRRFERTVALIDVSAADCYVVDIFRAAGGKEHTRFMHSHFAEVSSRSLNLQPEPDFGHGTQMRNYRMDKQPRPERHVDWIIQDHYKYLPEGQQVRVRCTDLTNDAQVGLIEGWIVAGLYDESQEQWIPRMAVRRQAPGNGGLESTFVAVIEPYETRAIASAVRRLPLLSEQDEPLSDSHVALVIQLADGRRDVVIARDPEDKTAAGMIRSADFDVRTDAELVLVRLTAEGSVEYAIACHGTRLTSKDWTFAIPAGADFAEWPSTTGMDARVRQ
ncbi:MAG TPA: heparinase II/III family protein [Phycisphaerae bacterium]|nr:heparinase II/III family protein [Phycisphaerae bacterium]HRR85242.1 heparinase II/III family protein [Phycisphaerae bacterium]